MGRKKTVVSYHSDAKGSYRPTLADSGRREGGGFLPRTILQHQRNRILRRLLFSRKGR